MSDEQWTFLEEFRFHSGKIDNVPLLKRFVEYVEQRQLPEGFEDELAGDGLNPYTLQDLVEPIGEEKTTALHCACANGCLENAKFLVETLSARIYLNESGNTPLHWAAQNGHAQVVSWLIETFPDLDVLAKNYFGRSPLAMAFESQNEECVLAVLNHESASQLVPEDERAEDAREFQEYKESLKHQP